MKKWEYKMVACWQGSEEKDQQTMKELNQLGKEGWRLVPVTRILEGLVMEREIPESQTFELSHLPE